MENHPIPQDVTGFKFKLIGSVTVKQFLYIMGGGILAAICYVLPISAFIKIPLSLIFGGLGTAIAFVPIEGRPMDVMLKNFLRALPAENQYIFRKKGAEALISEFFFPQTLAAIKTDQTKTREEETLDTRRALLYKTLKQSYKPDDHEQAVLTNINSYLNESSHSAAPHVQNVDNVPKDTSPALQIVTPSVTIATKEIRQVPLPAAPQDPDPQVLINIAQKVQGVNNTSNDKLVMPTTPFQQQTPHPTETPLVKPSPSVQAPDALRPITATPPTNPMSSVATPLQTTPNVATQGAVVPNQNSRVTTVTPELSLKAGFPQLPDIPNIVLGVIKDPRGKVMPNILVEIMDTQGIPVRAFKTNALGQFTAATPLSNGEYTVILDDPRKQNEFEQIHIILNGKIFNPLEIVSIDQREKLRRELFGGTPTQQRAVA